MTEEIKFPEEEIKIPKNLDKTHNLLDVTPFNEEKYSFSMMLPKSWGVTNDLGKQKIEPLKQIVLGGFYEKAAPDAAVISITFTPMPLELPLRDYVEYLNTQNKVATIHLKEWFNERPFVDIGGTFVSKVDGKTPYVIRIVGFSDGLGAYLINATVPKSRYIDEKTDLMKDIAIAEFTFKLLKPIGYGPTEKFVKTKIEDLKYSFTHPANWSTRVLESKLKGKSAVDLLLANNEELIGYLRIKAIDPKIAGIADEKTLLQTAKEEMRDAQVILQKDWVKDPEKNYKSIKGIVGTYLADGVINNTIVQLGCGIVKRGKLTFVLTLMCPKKEGNPIVWMHSKRVYEIVLNTVVPDKKD